MILFDNIYYLLYNYFERSKPVTFGSKLTSITLTTLYILVSILSIFYMTKIGYFFIVISGTISTSLTQDNFFSLDNKIVSYLIIILCILISDIRYFVIVKINEIQDKINDMDKNKRERLNVLTVSYMVASPFLMIFLANYVKDLYR